MSDVFRDALVPLVALGVVLAPSTAAAELTMKWDCYLPSGGIDCMILESSLTSKIPFLRAVQDPKSVDVEVILTSVPAESSTRYKFAFIGRSEDGYRTEVRSTDKIPSSVDSTTAMERIMTKLERGLDQFMDQRVAAGVRGGKLVLELFDPAQLPFSGRPEQESVKWYLAPSVGTTFSDVEGVGVNAWANASVSFNYSESRWRAQQSMSFNYNRQSQPVAGTDETASISFTGGNAVNVLTWGLTKDNRWSLGLLLSAEKNPQANYTMRANGSFGIEFDFVPRQTVNQENFGFRCAIGPEFQRYDATNIEGLDRQLVGRQFCDVFLSWHFLPIDLWASVGETSILEDFDYRSYSVGLSATWRVTDNLAVSPWTSLQQINQAIDEAQPNAVVSSDPRQEVEASMLAAVQQGYTAPFGIQAGLSVKYLLGNGSLSSEDQRWKNASNLR